MANCTGSCPMEEIHTHATVGYAYVIHICIKCGTLVKYDLHSPTRLAIRRTLIDSDGIIKVDEV